MSSENAKDAARNEARNEATDEFIIEGFEIVERVGRCLQVMESNHGEGTPEQISELYRDMHTLKGTAQLFGYHPIGMVAHAMEASLDPLRKFPRPVTPRLIDACIKNVNLLDRMLKALDQGKELSGDQEEIILLVTGLVDAAADFFEAELQLQKDFLFFEEIRTNGSRKGSQATGPQKGTQITGTQKGTQITGTQKGTQITVQKNEPPIEPKIEQRKDQENMSIKKEPPVAAPASAPAHEEHKAVNASDSTIRVTVSLLDRILNLVGELVLVRNQLLQYRNKIDDPEFLAASKSLDGVTSELQGEVMKTRMQPIETVVGKFQRLVRDISKDLNKKIDLTLEGSETELDKSLLEAVKDPLTHIVRNSCDHGIEGPEDRKKAGKPETGHLLIRSFHEGGQVVIEISDDGRGLSRQRIGAKALEKGLISQEQLSKMSDREICELIFLPGFSTAAQVTSVSGRGVGMDVVKTNIEKIGGNVEISSVEGKGTTLQLQIPLTLAIVPALLVRSGSEKFAIPQVKLVELLQIGGDSNQGKIEYLQGRPMYRLRGALLPLLDIREVTDAAKNLDYSEGVNVVVLNAEGEYFGLVVTEILDTADIVVKPLNALLNNLQLFSGATILGDGSVTLIIDVSGVAEYGNILSKKSHGEEIELFARSEKKSVMDVQEFLLLSLGTSSTHAIPLCLVQRLEEFEDSALEFSGEQRVIRYRGSLLPLIDLGVALNYRKPGAEAISKDPSGKTSVVVVQRSGRNYGLVVDTILDVISIDSAIDDTIRDRNGILGNVVHQESVIVVVDALGIVEGFDSKSPGGKSSSIGSSNMMEEMRERNRDFKFKKIRILYAEDVAFFRRHVSTVLSESGFEVTTVEDGAKALEELLSASDGQYNLVLSDIEMPKMNGLELARALRKSEKTKKLPLIALTTRFRDKDVADGREAGFDAYLEKLNPEVLLQHIQKLMGLKSVHPEVRD